MFVFLITESLASVLEKPVGNSNAKCLTEAFTVIKIQTKHKLIFSNWYLMKILHFKKENCTCMVCFNILYIIKVYNNFLNKF